MSAVTTGGGNSKWWGLTLAKLSHSNHKPSKTKCKCWLKHHYWTYSENIIIKVKITWQNNFFFIQTRQADRIFSFSSRRLISSMPNTELRYSGHHLSLWIRARQIFVNQAVSLFLRISWNKSPTELQVIFLLQYARRKRTVLPTVQPLIRSNWTTSGSWGNRENQCLYKISST